MLGEQPDAKRRDELKNDGGGNVTHPIHQVQHEPPQSGADDQAAGNSKEKGGRDITN